MQENEKPTNPTPTIPKPVFMRLLLLFGGGAGCLFVGIVVALATEDYVLLLMSVMICITFVCKGAFLKRKINTGQIYSVSGVCVNIAPKMLGRYRRVELVDTDTGNDTFFILPKKMEFKIGHVYTCYFDSEIGNRAVNDSTGGFFNAEDLPANGFLGFENFGVYQEKPIAAKNQEEKDESN
jgi:hypothetical protein